MSKSPQQFGGNWSADKLNRIQKYLSAYTTIMKEYRHLFKYAYIDAFAGTGYQQLKHRKQPSDYLFPEFEEQSQAFLDGSARNALNTNPPFDTYIFVEKNPEKIAQLELLKNEFSNKDIELVNEDCNQYLQELSKKNWNKYGYQRRAVLFLDPFGMQVEWKTIESIASTKAIDLWILFPLGVAVNRMLKKDGKINEVWRNRLDLLFGTDDWYDHFYQEVSQKTLFGSRTSIEKTSDFDTISKYFIARLRSVFSEVVETPFYLLNSRNNPLYLLCFASNNKTAKKIAGQILGK